MKIDERHELRQRLKSALYGDVYTDLFTRGRYATDASIYQMMPAGVVIPRSVADVQTTVDTGTEQSICTTYQFQLQRHCNVRRTIRPNTNRAQQQNVQAIFPPIEVYSRPPLRQACLAKIAELPLDQVAMPSRQTT